MLLREDQAIIHAGVGTGTDAVHFPGVYSWASLEGGDIEGASVKTRPGGMMPELDLGGPATRSDVTVKRQLSDAMVPFIVQLEQAVGRTDGWVTYIPLDADGNNLGVQITLTGKLKQVQKGTYDANASNPQFIALVYSLHVPSRSDPIAPFAPGTFPVVW